MAGGFLFAPKNSDINQQETKGRQDDRPVGSEQGSSEPAFRMCCHEIRRHFGGGRGRHSPPVPTGATAIASPPCCGGQRLGQNHRPVDERWLVCRSRTPRLRPRNSSSSPPA